MLPDQRLIIFSWHSHNLLLKDLSLICLITILSSTHSFLPSFLPPFLPSRQMARWSMAACWEMPTAWTLRRAEWRILGSGRSRGSLEKLWWSVAWSNGSSPARSHRTKVRGEEKTIVNEMVMNDQHVWLTMFELIAELTAWTSPGLLRSLWARLTTGSSAQRQLSCIHSFIKCLYTYDPPLIISTHPFFSSASICSWFSLFLPLTSTCIYRKKTNRKTKRLLKTSRMFSTPSWYQRWCVHGLLVSVLHPVVKMWLCTSFACRATEEDMFLNESIQSVCEALSIVVV